MPGLPRLASLSLTLALTYGFAASASALTADSSAAAGSVSAVASPDPVPAPGTADATQRKPAGRASMNLEYDRDLPVTDKDRAVVARLALFRELGIRVDIAPEAVAEMVRASGGRIEAGPVRNSNRRYDAVHYLGDIVRLPPAIHPVFRQIVVVENLRVEDPVSGRKKAGALAFEPATGAVVVDHENLNQLEMFGNFVHPKVNFAMLLQVALEGRLLSLGPAALRVLGLDLVPNDVEWARLNGGADGGRGAYSGEDVAFVGFVTAARVSPPGILFDAIRELQTGVPSDAYAGMPDAQQPWLSPRNSPAADRQTILRCLFSRDPVFFDRVGGRNGVKEDRVLREKTRLILYSAFVGSGGVLDHAYWTRRHRGNTVVDELTRDFDAAFIARLQAQIEQSPEASGTRLQLTPR